MSITLKVLDQTTQVAEYQVLAGQTLVIPAQANVNYQLIDNQLGYAPDNILAKREGNHLVIFLEDGDMRADILIENYYGDEGETTNLVVGLHENGQIYAYVPESGEVPEAISMLAEEVIAPQALGGKALESAVWAFNPYWLAGLVPLIGAAAWLHHARKDKHDTAQSPALRVELDPIKSGDAQITGKVNDPNAVVEITLPNGDKVTATVDKANPNPDGTYPFTAPIPSDTPLQSGDIVGVAATSPTHSTPVSNQATVTPTSGGNETENGQTGLTVTLDPIKSGDAQITGKVNDPNATVTITLPNGDKVTATVDKTNPNPDGTYPFTAPIPSDTPLQSDDIVGVAATSPTHSTPVSNQATVTPTSGENETENGQTGLTVTLDPIKSGDAQITGKVNDPNATVTITLPNGDKVTATVDKANPNPDGTYPFTAPIPSDTPLQSGDIVGVAATSPTHSTPVSNQATVTPTSHTSHHGVDVTPPDTAADKPTVTPSTTDGSVTVQPGGDNTKLVVTFPNELNQPQTVTIVKDPTSGKWTPQGDLPEGVRVDENGTVTIPENGVQDGSPVNATGTDANGNSANDSKPAGNDATPPDTAADKPTVTPSTTDGSVTVQPGGDNTKLVVSFPNESNQPQTVTIVKDPTSGKWTPQGDLPEGVRVDENGTVTIPESGVQDGSPVNATGTDANGNSANDSKPAGNDATPPDTAADKPTVTPSTTDGSVTVQPGGDNTKLVVTFPNEQNQPQTVTIVKDPTSGKWTPQGDLPEGVRVDENGTVTIPENGVQDGSPVNATGTDANGNSANDSKPAGNDATPPDTAADKPTVTPSTTDGSVTVQPGGDNTKLVVSFPNESNQPQTVTIVKDPTSGKWTPQGDLPEGVRVDENGTITIPESGVQDGSPVNATGTDANGNSANDSKPAGNDATPPDTAADKPTVTPSTTDGSVTVQPGGDNTKLVVTFPNEQNQPQTVTIVKDPTSGKWTPQGDLPEGVRVDENGTITIPESGVQDGSPVNATGTDANGNSANDSKPAGNDATPPDTAADKPTVTPSTTDGSVTVQPGGDNTKLVVTFPNEQNQPQTVTIVKDPTSGKWTPQGDLPEGVRVDENGTVTIPENGVQDGSPVNATGTDANGNSANDSKPAGNDATPPDTAADKPTVTPSTTDGSVTVQPGGDNTKLVVTFPNEQNQPQTVTIVKDPTSGKWTPQGDLPEGVRVDENGTVTIPENGVQDGSPVNATGTDANGNSANDSKPAGNDATPPDTAADKPTVTPSTTDGSVTVQPGGDNTKLVVTFPNEQNQPQTVTIVKDPTSGKWTPQGDLPEGVRVDENGTVTIPENGVQDGSPVNATGTDANGNSANDSKPAGNDATPPDTAADKPTVTPSTTDGSVTVQPGGDNTKLVVSFPNESNQPQTVTIVKDPTSGKWTPQGDLPEGVRVDENGTVTIPENGVQDGSPVNATGTDANGNSANDSKPAGNDATPPDTAADKPTVTPSTTDGSVTVQPGGDNTKLVVTFPNESNQPQTVTIVKDPTSGKWTPQGDLPEGVRVDENGTVTIPENGVQDGSPVNATGTDANGNSANDSKPAGNDATPPDTAADKPTVTPSTTDGSVTVQPGGDNTKLVVSFPNESNQPQTVTIVKDPTSGKWTPQGDLPEGVRVDENGTITIPENGVEDGSPVNATGTDANGNSATETQPAGNDATPPDTAADKPTVTPSTTDGSVTVQPGGDNTKLVVTFPNESNQPQTVTIVKDPTSGKWTPQGDLPEGVRVDENGTVTIPENGVQDGSPVNATGTDANGNSANDSKPAGNDATPPDTAADKPTVTPSTTDGSVTVQPGGDNTKLVVTFPNEQNQPQTVTIVKDPTSGKWTPQGDLPEGVRVDENGTVTIPENGVQDGSPVNATGTDANGNSANDSKPAGNDATPPDTAADKPTVTPSTTDGSVTVQPGGDNTKLVVTFPNEQNQPQTVTIVKDPTSGKWTPQGDLPEGVRVDENGTVTIPENGVEDGSPVNATGTDANGNSANDSKPAGNDATPPDTAADKPTVTPSTTDGSVTVQPGGDNTKLVVSFPNESNQPQTVTIVKDPTSGKWTPQGDLPEGVRVDENGTVTIPENGVQDGSPVNATGTDANGNSANDSKPAGNDATPPDTAADKPTVTPSTTDGSVTVQPGGDNTKLVVTFPNESNQPQTVTIVKDPTSGKWTPQGDLPEGVRVDENGTVTIPENGVQDGSPVNATGTDANGNSATETQPAGNDATPPDTAADKPTVTPSTTDGSVTVQPGGDNTKLVVSFPNESNQPQTVTIVKDPTSGKWTPQGDLPEGVRVDENGTVTIPENGVQDGSPVNATGTDANGNSATETQPAGNDATPPDTAADKPTVTPSTTDGSVTVQPGGDNTKLVVSFPNESNQPQTVTIVKDPTSGKWTPQGDLPEGVRVDENGTVTIPESGVQDGSPVTATGSDANGNSATETQPAGNDATPPDTAADKPTVTPSTTDGSVTVQPGGDNTKLVVSFPNESNQPQTVTIVKDPTSGKWTPQGDLPEGVRVDENGTVTIPENGVQDGSPVNATGTDANGNSATETQPAGNDATPPDTAADKPTVTPSTTDGSVTVQPGGDNTKLVVSFPNESNQPQTVTIVKDPTSGKWTPQGDLPEGVRVDENGTVTIPESGVQDGSPVTATGSDANGNSATETQPAGNDATPPDTAADKPTVTPSTTDGSVTVQPGGDNTKLVVTFPNESNQPQTVTIVKDPTSGKWTPQGDLPEGVRVDENGTVTIPESGVQDGSPVTATGSDANGNSATETQPAGNDATPPDTAADKPTVTPSTTDGSVTVQPGGDNTKLVVSFPNESNQPQTVTIVKDPTSGKWTPQGDLPEGVRVDENGTVTIPENGVQDGSPVNATGTDANGNSATETQPAGNDATPPDTAADKPTVTPSTTDGSVTVQPGGDNTKLVVSFPNESNQPQTVTIVKDPTSGKWTPQGDLPEGVRVDENGTVTIPESGVQDGSPVTATGSDANGNSATETQPAGNDATPPDTAADKPTVTPSTTDGSVTVQPGGDNTKLVVTFPNESNQPQTVTIVKDPTSGKWTPQGDLPEGVRVDENGTITIPESGVQDGSPVNATGTDANGNSANDSKPAGNDATPPDNTKPTLTLNPIKAGETTVSGTVSEPSTVEVSLPNGNKVTATVSPTPNAEGVYPYTASVPALNEKETVTVNATDPANNSATPVSGTTPDETRPVITLNPIKAGETMVSGTVSEPSTVEVSLPNGNKVTATVSPTPNAEGVYPYTASVPALNEKETVTVNAKDPANNSATPVSGTTPDETRPVITLNPIKAGETTVSGTVSEPSTVEVSLPNGNKVTATVSPTPNAEGVYPYTAAVPALNEKETVTVNAKDPANNSATPVSGTTPDETRPVITLNPIKAGETTVSGTVSEPSTVEVSLPNGNKVTATVSPTPNAEGVYPYTASVPALNEKETVTVNAKDPANNSATPVSGTTPALPQAELRITPESDGSVTLTQGEHNTALTVTYWNEKNAQQIKGAEHRLGETVTFNDSTPLGQNNEQEASTYSVVIGEAHTEQVTLVLSKQGDRWVRTNGDMPEGVSVSANGTVTFQADSIMGRTEIRATATGTDGSTRTETATAEVDMKTVVDKAYLEPLSSTSPTVNSWLSAFIRESDQARLSQNALIINPEKARINEKSVPMYILEYTDTSGQVQTKIFKLGPWIHPQTQVDEKAWYIVPSMETDVSNYQHNNIPEREKYVSWNAIFTEGDTIALQGGNVDLSTAGLQKESIVRLWSYDPTKNGEWQLQDSWQVPEEKKHETTQFDDPKIDEMLAASTRAQRDIYIEGDNDWSAGLRALMDWNGSRDLGRNHPRDGNGGRLFNGNNARYFEFQEGLSNYAGFTLQEPQRTEARVAKFNYTSGNDYLLTTQSIGALHNIPDQQNRIKNMRFNFGDGADMVIAGRDIGTAVDVRVGTLTMNMGNDNDLVVAGAGNHEVVLGINNRNGEVDYFFTFAGGVPTDSHTPIAKLNDFDGREGGRLSGNVVINMDNGDDTLIVEGIATGYGEKPAVAEGARVNMGAGNDFVLIASYSGVRGDVDSSTIDLGSGNDYISIGGHLTGSTRVHGGAGIDSFDYLATSPNSTLDYTKTTGFEYVRLKGGNLNLTWESVASAGLEAPLHVYGSGQVTLNGHEQAVRQETEGRFTYNVYSNGQQEIYIAVGVELL